MKGGNPLSTSLPLEATPNNSLAYFNSLPATPQDTSAAAPDAGAKSTGSIRGAVRALFRAQNAVPDTSAAAELPPRPSALTARGFQEVSLSDSPRAVAYTAISRNSAHNISALVPGPAPPLPGHTPQRSPSLAKLPPIDKPRKAQQGQADVISVVPSGNSAASQASTSSADGINTFQVGARREAPPPALLPQHHVRSSSAGSRLELATASHFDQQPSTSLPLDTSEKAGLLQNQQNGVGTSTARSDAGSDGAAGPSWQGGGGSGGRARSGNHKAEATHLEMGAAGASGSGSCCGMDPLLFATLLGVVAGIAGGLMLRLADLSDEQIDLLGFLGELMLRLLKMLVLPLIAGSMIAGVCALRGSTSSMAKVARCTLLYYGASTAAAVVLGILLVNVIQPGRGEPLAGGAVTSCRQPDRTAAAAAVAPRETSPLQALLAVARSAVPDNVAAAAVNMNILGIITFSLFFGLCLAGLGEQADGLISLVNAFNAVISKMVTAVLWTSPLGIASLIAAAICRACSLIGTLGALGLWLGTILCGLALFGMVLLPLVFWGLTRKRPLDVARGFSRALVLAFGTSSSSAALPVAMECANEMGCDENIVRFVMPLGTTVNMNGTALYEATTVIFLAQAHGVVLGLGGTIVVAVTATLAAIGAASIPSAGLVTMLMVLQAVGLDCFASDLAVILALDWLLDRCRTAINLLGDAFGVVLIDHLAGGGHSSSQASSRHYSQLELT